MLLPVRVKRARAGLRQAAAAADDAAVGQRVGVIEDQGAVAQATLRAGQDSPLPPLPICSVPAVIVVAPL